MPWKQGQSGNPNGRPPKSRALTDILERAGAKTLDAEGKRISGKQWLASAIWEALTTGVVTFPNGQALQLAPEDWLSFAKWIYQHIDGPAKAELDVTSGGEPLKGYTVVAHPDMWDGDGSDGDS